MLEQAFFNVYTKFKLHFYQEIFRRFQDREASLTTVETFCMETIQALGTPTVNEFATFMRISPPNAAYKVNSLVKKGYIHKVQSREDKREYHLEVTKKYIDYYNISTSYMVEVMGRITKRFSPEDCAKLEEMLTLVSRELMPEVAIPDAQMPR
ncbi:MarR family winged helix-turn-helix transcriptional regulator [Dysosmobacter sp.]